MDIKQAAEILKFENASKTYVDEKFRRVRALESVNLAVNRGEFVSIIGPSGCGKSTLLRLAAGLESLSEGAVYFNGQPVTEPDRRKGFVFQSYNSFPWLTVFRNIAFGLDGGSRADKREKIERWLKFTGLTEFADSYPKSLSGGMRQRLALARTMVIEPELLLMDEPFGALDERIRESMQRLLLEAVTKTSCSVLFVTHDIREAILLGDRVVLLSARPGRIQKVFESPLPKPRTREHLKSAEFMKLYEEILDQFPT
jgi:NitT/TauT family transport system ATP-binding protein